MFVMTLAGWVNEQQRAVHAYLKEENRVLRELHGKRRLRAAGAARAVGPAQFGDGAVQLGNLLTRLGRTLDGAIARLFRTLQAVAQLDDDALQRPVAGCSTHQRTTDSGACEGQDR